MTDFLYQYVHGVGEYSIILGTDYNITCKIGSARLWSLHIRKIGKQKALELDNSMYVLTACISVIYSRYMVVSKPQNAAKCKE